MILIASFQENVGLLIVKSTLRVEGIVCICRVSLMPSGEATFFVITVKGFRSLADSNFSVGQGEWKSQMKMFSHF